jgi:uncharacterized glyoxalase superfamily protein PhnB
VFGTVEGMLRRAKPVAFVPTTDIPRARSFFEGTLGLRVAGEDPFALTLEGSGTTVRVSAVRELTPAPFTVLGWEVDDLDASVRALTEKVKFERFPGLEQDALGIWTAPSGDRVAWFKDPDGNVLSLSQHVAPAVPRDRVVPEIFVHDGPAALEFYKTAFGAREVGRMMTPDGKKLIHGELVLLRHRLFVVDEFDASQGGTCRAPRTLGGTPVRVTLEVDDADAFVARAVAAGARVLLPVKDLFWGARYGKIVDPFGHEWGINEQQREVEQPPR